MYEPKIVFLTSGHSPFTPRLFHKELISLRKIFRDLTIIAPYDKLRDSVDGISIYGVPKYKSRYNRWATLSALYRKARELRPTVIHCHEPDSLLVSFLLKTRFPQVKVIYDCHEFHPQSFTEHFPNPFRNLIKILIEITENYLVSRIEAVVTVNDRLVERFSKQNESITLLPNYPKKDIFRNERRKRTILSTDTVHLIYVGLVSSDRGVFRMVEVIRELEKSVDIKLTLIGKCSSESLKKEFIQKVNKFKLRKKIQYMGHLPHNETIEHLMNADIALFLVNNKERYHWGESTKYFEYSAASLPIIISDLPAKRSLIEKNKNGILVNYDSVEEIVNAVQYLIKNKGEARMMGGRGRSFFESHYNWDAIESRLLTLYKNLTSVNRS